MKSLLAELNMRYFNSANGWFIRNFHSRTNTTNCLKKTDSMPIKILCGHHSLHMLR